MMILDFCMPTIRISYNIISNGSSVCADDEDDTGDDGSVVGTFVRSVCMYVLYAGDERAVVPKSSKANACAH